MLQSLLLSLVASVALVLGDIQVSIDEEVPVGTDVARLTDYRSTYTNSSAGYNWMMTYDILNQNNAPAKFFKIDPNTGAVTVARRIDREAICDPTDTCSVKFNIAVHANITMTTVVTLEVTINDINDNPPMFPARDVTLDIPEGSKVGTEIKISGPVDRDSKPEFVVQRYNMTPALDTFGITPVTNLDGSITIILRLERELDREIQDEYRFQIFAHDGGSNPQSDSLSVTFRVLDDNDNIPVFNQSRYEIVINENEQSGAQVGQVTATDKDIGENGRISYQFSSNSIKGVFSINPSTGWITLQGDARSIRKSSSQCQLFVDAKDGGEPPLSSQACVSVQVINSGNSPPQVMVNTITEGDVSTLSIPESAVLDHFLAFVDVVDSDEGDNGKVTCQILSGPDFRLSPVPNKGYTLLLNTSVDREKKDSHHIQISCKDGGSPQLEIQVPKDLTVNITDVNDNTPMFVKNLYTGTVDESRDPGQFIAQVLAIDADTGINAEITYSVQRDAHEYIRINSKTGVISTSSAVDREKNATLRFKILAIDGGEQPRTGVAEIYIVVNDVNDNSPQFTKSKFIFPVSEQIPNKTIVGTLAAYDLDIGVNGQFDFYFGGSTKGDSPLPFSVLKNGSIQVNGFIDRESKALYSFTAIVRDRGDIPKSNTVPVEIKILDENDNDPVILFPTHNNHTIVISSSPENGMVLGRVIAYDVDEDDISSLRFHIFDGNQDGAFSIGLKNGELVLQSMEKLQNPQEYYLSIKVEDAETRPRNATTQLRIDVRFENLTEIGFFSQNDSPREHYVVIVGVIGGATIMLSIIIISAIFFILHSDKNRRNGRDGSFFKNNFCSGTTVQTVSDEKHVDSLGATKSHSNSSIGSDPHGMILSPGNLGKKHEDVQKKVSFSLNDEFHDQSHVLLPEKKFCLSLHHVAESSWKKFTKPDDINSDASGESGTCDSGRGTSDEDIKFDHSPGICAWRTGDAHMASRDRSFDQCMPPTVAMARSAPNTQGQSTSRNHTPAIVPKPDRSHFKDTTSGRHDVPGTTSNYHGQRQLSHSTFSLGQPSVRMQPSHNPTQNSHKNGVNQNMVPPGSAQTYTSQSSAVSVDDNASTTTSGSYVMNPDDVLLDVFMGTDIVV